MSEPSLELQGAIRNKLLAASAVTVLVGERIYDSVPRDGQGNVTAAFPYVTLGEDQVLASLADCYDGADVALTLHAWSRKPGYPEAKKLGNAIAEALHEADLNLSENRLLFLEFEGAQYLRDPDGKTSHGVITFRASTEPVA